MDRIRFFFIGRTLVVFGVAVCAVAARFAVQTEAPLTIYGSGFEIHTLRTGGEAFGNRHYVWRAIPAMFDGWEYTEVKGGKAAEINVYAPRETDVYIASAEAAPSGWQMTRDADFSYDDKNGTVMHVYGIHVAAETRLRIPQNGWAGTLVLGPYLTGEAGAAPVVVHHHHEHAVELVPVVPVVVASAEVRVVHVHPHVAHAHVAARHPHFAHPHTAVRKHVKKKP
jgi:hypothetical protein